MRVGVLARRRSLCRMADTGLEITFTRRALHRYDALLARGDGVVVRLTAGGFNRIDRAGLRVPHDLAHMVVESHLGIDDGLWGVLGRGGLFGEPNTVVVSGRRRPHAEAHAAAIVAECAEGLRRAEVVVRAVADLVAAGRAHDVDRLRAALGARWALAVVDAPMLERAADGLRAGADLWDATPVGGEIPARWPMPAEPASGGMTPRPWA